MGLGLGLGLGPGLGLGLGLQDGEAVGHVVVAAVLGGEVRDPRAPLREVGVAVGDRGEGKGHAAWLGLGIGLGVGFGLGQGFGFGFGFEFGFGFGLAQPTPQPREPHDEHLAAADGRQRAAPDGGGASEAVGEQRADVDVQPEVSK